VDIPGDKSVSHRALMLAALGRGISHATNVNLGGDVLATARCLSALGAQVRVDEASHEVEVEGYGWAGLGEPGAVLDAGNSGTTARIVSGMCSGVAGLTVVSGDDTLRRRPMLRVVVPLRQMGAHIDGRDHGRLLPLAIRGGELVGIDLDMDVASAQVKTAVLLAGLRAAGTTRVTEPQQSRDHTERMLKAIGAPIELDERTVAVSGGSELPCADWAVPGDISSAMFLIAGAALVAGSDLTVRGVGLNPTRMGGLHALRAMGADIEVTPTGEAAGEAIGDISARHSSLTGVELDPELSATYMDEVPVLALAATQAEGTTVIRGAAELRVKESDRIATIAGGLRALGAKVEERPDGLAVHGPSPLSGGEIDSYGDHRVALTFAVAGLISSDRVRVLNWSCVDTSFPEFLEILALARSHS
jgi:3-phosphoshikimate 1-carboxyvinyltransferase